MTKIWYQLVQVGLTRKTPNFNIKKKLKLCTNIIKKPRKTQNFEQF